MDIETYDEILASCGGQIEVIDRRERMRLVQAWRERYAWRLRSTAGKSKLGGFDWGVFCTGHTRALCGSNAILEYQQQSADSLIVCPERVIIPAMRIIGGKLPDFRPTADDVYVWPDDLAWIMAFTHEELIGFGPYFSRSEWAAEPSRVEARQGHRRRRGR